jgi:clan AA aspartic protease (TIGR02281 family)
VDTGASVCVISPELAAAVGIRADPNAEIAKLSTLGGPTSGPLVKIPLVRAGDHEAKDVVAVIHETGDRLDGILGNTFLARYTATLDPTRGTLHLRPK